MIQYVNGLVKIFYVDASIFIMTAILVTLGICLSIMTLRRCVKQTKNPRRYKHLAIAHIILSLILAYYSYNFFRRNYTGGGGDSDWHFWLEGFEQAVRLGVFASFIMLGLYIMNITITILLAANLIHTRNKNRN